DAGYNTTYAASWFLVRSELVTDEHGNVKSNAGPSCTTPNSALERHCTLGPLRQAKADSSGVASSIIPFLGDAAPSSKFLSAEMGTHPAGAPMLQSFTHGPVSKTTGATLTFSSSTTYDGPTGW